MSTFESYGTRTHAGPRGRALAGDASLSSYQEHELAGEALEIQAEEQLEEFLTNVLGGVAAGAGEPIRPAVARQLGGILKGVGAATLPGGPGLVSLMDPGPGEVVGSKLGWIIDRLLEIDLQGMSREEAELERARRYVGIATTSARHAARAPRDVAPRRVVRSALAHALTEHVPDLLERALAGETALYAGISDGTVVGVGLPFSPVQVAKIINANRARNGGTVMSDDDNDPHKILSDPGTGWSVDHIVPRSGGGSNSYANARVISHRYNSRLGAKGYGRSGARRPGAPRRAAAAPSNVARRR
jgi:hypothetical protein